MVSNFYNICEILPFICKYNICFIQKRKYCNEKNASYLAHGFWPGQVFIVSGGFKKKWFQSVIRCIGIVFQKINRGLKHGYIIANFKISLLQNRVKYVESISQRASIVEIQQDWPSLDILEQERHWRMMLFLIFPL